MINAFIIHPDDDVVTVSEVVLEGENVTYIANQQKITLIAKENIPKYHKMAIKTVRCGENVHKYGEVIGYATADIDVGTHVHIQNLSDMKH